MTDRRNIYTDDAVVSQNRLPLNVGGGRSSSPLRKSGIGLMTDCGRLRLWTTPCALRDGKLSTSKTEATSKDFHIIPLHNPHFGRKFSD